MPINVYWFNSKDVKIIYFAEQVRFLHKLNRCVNFDVICNFIYTL